ncbi:MAG: anthranilate phosphoribosyltransferase [Verrucomicrobiae bacterium]|nr:anthranilate phosphoribosyltransferase [Verrucomicrobiae bacterium]
MLDVLTEGIRQGRELVSTEISKAVAALTDEGVPAEVKAEFLMALARRGETPAEIAGFALELRDLAVAPPIRVATRERGIVDVCGTGGDHRNTFNISTTVALVLASAGVPVAKHGNRAITSKAGSADVLEALGIPIELPPAEAAEALEAKDFAFFFAPRYHPAFKHLAAARKLCAGQGQRTIFNFLGPLLNPARPSGQLVGVSVPSLCAPLARVLQELGLRRAMVVCGETPEGALDELSVLGDTQVAEFHHERGFSTGTLSAADWDLPPATLADLAGGDREENAAIVRRILAGEERGVKREAVLLNAGAALFVAGRAGSIQEGRERAAEEIDSGAAAAKLDQLRA